MTVKVSWGKKKKKLKFKNDSSDSHPAVKWADSEALIIAAHSWLASSSNRPILPEGSQEILSYRLESWK